MKKIENLIYYLNIIIIIFKKTLFSINKKQKYEDFLLYMSKMYLNKKGSKSANRSTMKNKD